MNLKMGRLKNLIKIVSNIADAKYQERVWLEGIGPGCDDFDETMCSFFDDYNAEEVLQNYKNYGLSKKQYQVFLKFYEMLDEYGDYSSEEGIVEAEIILKDPKWHKIQEFAKKVLKVFEDFDFSEKKE